MDLLKRTVPAEIAALSVMPWDAVRFVFHRAPRVGTGPAAFTGSVVNILSREFEMVACRRGPTISGVASKAVVTVIGAKMTT